MLNLFGKNVFARKRKAKVMPIDCGSRIETLEERAVLTNVAVTYSAVTGSLTINGSGGNDDVSLDFDQTTPNQITLSGGATYFVNGSTTSTATPSFIVTGTLTVNMGNGTDTVHLNNASGGNALFDGGDVSIDLGTGNDTLDTTGNDLIEFRANVSILGGTGNDTIGLGTSTAGATATASISAYSLAIDAGTGVAESVYVDQTDVSGNVSIKTGGTGTQTVTLGGQAAQTFTGNLTISIANGAADSVVTVDDTDVDGNVAVTLGTPVANVLNTIDWATSDVGGTTTFITGNATGSGLNTVLVDASTLSGNVTVKNGTAVAKNAIVVTGSTLNGKTNTFSNNTAGTSSTITFGVVGGGSANTIAGVLNATNSSATGDNTINVFQNDINSSVNLVNGSGSTPGNNRVNVGNAASAVGITGNLVITNSAATASNEVDVSNLTTDGAKAGNVTINNGAVSAGTTKSLIGTTAANDIGGTLTIRNQATSGLRTTTAENTDIAGSFFLYNVGAGNTDTNFGAAGVALNVTGVVKIEDGNGTSAVNLTLGTFGSFNFADLGGGTDTIVIGDTNGSTVTINGVAKLDTGAGSDVVTIASVGNAYFNDSLFITLGAGNDNLTIGNNASSPALNTASKFQFDGGSGVDTGAFSTISIADYDSASPPGKKLRFKITNFEILS